MDAISRTLEMLHVDMVEDDKDQKNLKSDGCDGPNSRYVVLISREGYEFILKREQALLSGTIKAMLSGDGQFSKNETNKIHLKDISSHVLYNVCMYLEYKDLYSHCSTEIPEFPISPELALDLLYAAKFLDC